ncbi:MAG: hypothetical protein EZS28_056166, partial [Streblomastix strix]
MRSQISPLNATLTSKKENKRIQNFLQQHPEKIQLVTKLNDIGNRQKQNRFKSKAKAITAREKRKQNQQGAKMIAPPKSYSYTSNLIYLQENASKTLSWNDYFASGSEKNGEKSKEK